MSWGFRLYHLETSSMSARSHPKADNRGSIRAAFVFCSPMLSFRFWIFWILFLNLGRVSVNVCRAGSSAIPNPTSPIYRNSLGGNYHPLAPSLAISRTHRLQRKLKTNQSSKTQVRIPEVSDKAWRRLITADKLAKALGLTSAGLLPKMKQESEDSEGEQTPEPDSTPGTLGIRRS